MRTVNTNDDVWEKCDGRENRTLRVLAVTNMLPTPEAPHAGRFIEQQIEGLRRAGMDVEVLLLDRVRLGMRIYAHLPALVQKKIAEYQPDLVHVMYGGIMAGLVAHVVQDRPVVVSFHGSDLLGQPFERFRRRLIAGCGVLASKQAAKRCSGVVLVAEHLRRSLPARCSKAQIRIIPCGIDLKLFKPLSRKACCEKLGWAQGKFHILFQNTGDPVKQPALAYAALDVLRRLGVDAEIHELRGVAYGQVPVWLNASDALLVTSFHEGSPTIVKEALACNLPVVSVGVGDVPLRLAGIRGCYISEPTAAELAENLRRVQMHPQRIEASKAADSLSTDHSVRLLGQLYADVLRVEQKNGMSRVL